MAQYVPQNYCKSIYLRLFVACFTHNALQFMPIFIHLFSCHVRLFTSLSFLQYSHSVLLSLGWLFAHSFPHFSHRAVSIGLEMPTFFLAIYSILYISNQLFFLYAELSYFLSYGIQLCRFRHIAFY